MISSDVFLSCSKGANSLAEGVRLSKLPVRMWILPDCFCCSSFVISKFLSVCFSCGPQRIYCFLKKEKGVHIFFLLGSLIFIRSATLKIFDEIFCY